MACWMVAYSFDDVCRLQRRIRPLDKLFDVAVIAIEEENLMESSSIEMVYNTLEKTTNVKVRKDGSNGMVTGLRLQEPPCALHDFCALPLIPTAPFQAHPRQAPRRIQPNSPTANRA